MFKTDPRASRDTAENRVIFERNLQTVHRFIQEHDKPDYDGEKHCVYLPFPFEMIDKPRKSPLERTLWRSWETIF
jgi:hypothetical protein